MSTTPDEHKVHAPRSVRCAVVTISDTRTRATDTGGQEIVDRLAAAGHEIVLQELIPDEIETIQQVLTQIVSRGDADAILLTGGTGITRRDTTYEAVSGMLSKALPGYGELFRMLSFAEIGPAAMLSRATGGLIDRTVVFAMPGSRAAVRLALDKIILPELAHLVWEARR
jgi:molybdenum cofactor biosynthesis protein B